MVVRFIAVLAVNSPIDTPLLSVMSTVLILSQSEVFCCLPALLLLLEDKLETVAVVSATSPADELLFNLKLLFLFSRLKLIAGVDSKEFDAE